jgi:transcriptional regulator with XRE-family HTH domain
MTIGERVTRLRTRRNMSQTELSRASGVPLSVINMLEAGIRSGENLRVETARKLANALSVTLDYLCGVHEEDDGSLWPPSAADACRLPAPADQMHHAIASAVL